MNEKEVAELRRLLRADRHNITKIYGCYVNENRSIINTFEQSVALATEEELDAYLNQLKKVLSGTLGRNLLDLAFSNQSVMHDEEHALLMKLRETKLEDEEVRNHFYEKVIASVYLEENYLILMAFQAYDVPYRAKDDTVFSDGSEEIYSHILCSIAPVKQSKPGLGYDYSQAEFRTIAGNHLVGAPEVGFLFPAFDGRSTNIYNALCYTRRVDENHEAWIDTIFHTEVPKPAAEQKKDFETVLSGALEEECSMEVVQAVHDQLTTLIAEHKESKVADPLMIESDTVEQVLKDCGVSQQHCTTFHEQFVNEFGENHPVSPKNLIDEKRFEVTMPQITIRMKPEARERVQTRVIDGIKYILIQADAEVEVNGVAIRFTSDL